MSHDKEDSKYLDRAKSKEDAQQAIEIFTEHDGKITPLEIALKIMSTKKFKGATPEQIKRAVKSCENRVSIFLGIELAKGRLQSGKLEHDTGRCKGLAEIFSKSGHGLNDDTPFKIKYHTSETGGSLEKIELTPL
jgi:ABC-type transporter MlaC component